jgi:NAD(P)-dependent dehydrogenase (short-subunit alcohol dehydrogenase family)
VCDGAGGLARHDAGEPLPRTGYGTLVDGAGALSAALAGVWNAIRLLAVPALLEAGRPGRVILIAPPPSGSPLADAVRAALENLARTLSVEWARHTVTAASVAPGAGTTPEEVAALVAFLASPAGAYYSGCQLDLRGPLPRTG